MEFWCIVSYSGIRVTMFVYNREGCCWLLWVYIKEAFGGGVYSNICGMVQSVRCCGLWLKAYIYIYIDMRRGATEMMKRLFMHLSIVELYERCVVYDICLYTTLHVTPVRLWIRQQRYVAIPIAKGPQSRTTTPPTLNPRPPAGLRSANHCSSGVILNFNSLTAYSFSFCIQTRY